MIYSVAEANGEVSFWFGLDPEADPNRYCLCTATAEQAPEVEKWLQSGLRLERSYAEVLWTTADVHQLAEERGLEVSDSWARDYLSSQAKNVQNVMTERGWDALAQFMPTTQEEVAAAKHLTE